MRKKIDRIDDRIVRLLNERCEIAALVGDWKSRNSQPFYVPEREKELYDRLESLNDGPLPQRALRAIYREIISASISLEKAIRIGFRAGDDCAREAARETFGDSAEYVACKTPSLLVASVADSDCDYGIIPCPCHARCTEPEAYLKAVLMKKEVGICAKRVCEARKSYYVIGLHSGASCRGACTSVVVKLKSNSSDTAIRKLIPPALLNISCDIPTPRGKLMFLELSSHEASDEFRGFSNALEQELGPVRVLGSYPVFQ